jgi:hypothetical protein
MNRVSGSEISLAAHEGVWSDGGKPQSRASTPDPFARLRATTKPVTTPSGPGLSSGSVVAPAESIASTR